MKKVLRGLLLVFWAAAILSACVGCARAQVKPSAPVAAVVPEGEIELTDVTPGDELEVTEASEGEEAEWYDSGEPEAAGHYTLRCGDTLWGLAERFWHQPFHWPLLWRLNRDFIKEPDWILEGDVIGLPVYLSISPDAFWALEVARKWPKGGYHKEGSK